MQVTMSLPIVMLLYSFCKGRPNGNATLSDVSGLEYVNLSLWVLFRPIHFSNTWGSLPRFPVLWTAGSGVSCFSFRRSLGRAFTVTQRCRKYGRALTSAPMGRARAAMASGFSRLLLFSGKDSPCRLSLCGEGFFIGAPRLSPRREPASAVRVHLPSVFTRFM